MTEIVNGTEIIFPDEMSLSEAKVYLQGQSTLYPGARLKQLELEIEDGYVIIKPHYDTITRIRRITGYLSELPNFNQAKQEEEKVRIKHVEGGL